MGHFTRCYLLGFTTFIKRRISWVSEVFQAKIWNAGKFLVDKYQKKISSVMLLAISGLLGIWSHHSSQSDAIKNWEKTFIPSQGAIRALMKGHGLRRLEDAREIQKAIRKIPTRLDQEGSIWYAHDVHQDSSPVRHPNQHLEKRSGERREKRNVGQWVAFFFDADEAIQMHVYCYPCENVPDQWLPMGMGWRGFEALTNQLEQKRFWSPVIQLKKDQPAFRDPLEIRY